MDKCDIFISYKFHNKYGDVLPDYYMAKDLYERLQIEENINTFFSDKSIVNEGESDYKRLIEKKLDEAKILILVTTSPENSDSGWVRFEWDSFFSDILSGTKDGVLISYIDYENKQEFPRAIRNNEIFDKGQDGIDKLVTFVKNALKNKEDKNDSKVQQGGSSYNYDIGDEQRRLRLQAAVESSNDYTIIKDWFTDKDKTYTVLDVGCSMGAVTAGLFGRFNNVRVLGVDKFEKCVTYFNENVSKEFPNMTSEVVNFDSDDWMDELREKMNKNNIDNFDLVYCSLSLHHMANSKKVVEGLYKFIKNEGHIFIRTCDDALKLSYPHSEVMDEIIKMTASTNNVSDRFHGRKVYNQLQFASFEDITIKNFMIDTTGKSMKERIGLYISAFDWRKNYFLNNYKNAKSDEEIKKAKLEYDKMCNLLDNIENLFRDISYYFSYYITIAYGTKRSLYGLY